MTDAYRLLAARTEDLFRLCEKYAEPRFSQFLDGGEAAYIEDNVVFPYGFNTMFFGGFHDSERRILGVFPEWIDAEEGLFPLSVLKISGGVTRGLTHRDYLGTMLSLGIDRSKTGDIIIAEDGFAYAAVMSDIAEYIADNIKKIGNQGVKISVLESAGDVLPLRRFKNVSGVCASLRLDAVTAAVAGISRASASKLIAGEKVKLNYRAVTDPSRSVKEGDLISVRGEGRFIFDGAGSETRSGRIHIFARKFI